MTAARKKGRVKSDNVDPKKRFGMWVDYLRRNEKHKN